MSELVKPTRVKPTALQGASVGKSETAEWIVARPLSVLAEMNRTRAFDWAGILGRYDLSPDEIGDHDRKIDVHDGIAIFEDVACAIGDDAAIMNEFSALPVGYAYTFDYVGLLAASLRDSLRNWQRFYTLHSNSLVLKYSEDTRYGMLECRLPESAAPANQATYAFIAWIAGRIELVLQTVAEQIHLEFAVPPPAQTCEFLEKYANRTSFNQETNRILIPKGLLDSRPPGADHGLLKIVEDAAVLDMQDLLRQTSAVSDVSATIGDCLKAGDCSAGAVASALGMTQKALQSALEKEGTSFRNIREDVRCSMAEHYLVNTDLPMKEIAYLLGFSETSALSRAVKKWFGKPPRAIRAQWRDQ